VLPHVLDLAKWSDLHARNNPTSGGDAHHTWSVLRDLYRLNVADNILHKHRIVAINTTQVLVAIVDRKTLKRYCAIVIAINVIWNASHIPRSITGFSEHYPFS
jgi:hypothetical protein